MVSNVFFLKYYDNKHTWWYCMDKDGRNKHEYLPKVVMASDFEAAWDEYMSVYEKCNPQDFLEEMQTELDRRMEEAKKYQ